MPFIDNTENPETLIIMPNRMVWELLDLWFKWFVRSEEQLAKRTYVRQVRDDWVCLEELMTKRLNERTGKNFYSVFEQEEAKVAWQEVVEENEAERVRQSSD